MFQAICDKWKINYTKITKGSYVLIFIINMNEIISVLLYLIVPRQSAVILCWPVQAIVEITYKDTSILRCLIILKYEISIMQGIESCSVVSRYTLNIICIQFTKSDQRMVYQNLLHYFLFYSVS